MSWWLTCSYLYTILVACLFFQLSYSSASPALSDKTKYKRFFRVFPPESSFNPAKFDLLDMFNWKKVATLNYVGDEIFSIVSYIRGHLTSLLFCYHLGLGNVFTDVRLSGVGGWWYPSMHHRSHDQHPGVLPPGRICIQRGLHLGADYRGICIQGVCLQSYRGSASRGSVSRRGACMQEGVCLHKGWTDTPTRTRKGAVHIPLECFLFSHKTAWIFEPD